MKIKHKKPYLNNMPINLSDKYVYNDNHEGFNPSLLTDLLLLVCILWTMRYNGGGLNIPFGDALHYSINGIFTFVLLIFTCCLIVFSKNHQTVDDRYYSTNATSSSSEKFELKIDLIHESGIILLMLESLEINNTLCFNISFMSDHARKLLEVQKSFSNHSGLLSDIDSPLVQKSVPICANAYEAREYCEEEIDVPGAEPDTLEWYRCQVWPHLNSLIMVLTRTTDTHWLNELIKQQIDSITESHIELEEHATNLAGANQRLEDLASTDGLTGLKNYRAFQQEVRKLFERNIRNSTPLSLILLDVDHFKKYNDSMGHPAGDELLRKLGEILLKSARNHDFVARYGGEEFVVLLPNTDVEGSIKFAERLRSLIADEKWEHRPVTISLGIATLNDTIYSPELMLEAADRALYISKRAGRNQATHIINIENHSIL